MGFVQDRLCLHAGLRGPKTVSTFKRQEEILLNLEIELEARGITKYYTAVKTQRQLRYAMFMGFRPIDEHITGTPYQFMLKEL